MGHREMIKFYCGVYQMVGFKWTAAHAPCDFIISYFYVHFYHLLSRTKALAQRIIQLRKRVYKQFKNLPTR